MERSIHFSRANITIHGILTRSVPHSKCLIILVHGLADHSNTHVLFNAARVFPKYGFDTFRFDLYNVNNGSALSGQSIRKQIRQLSVILGHFRTKYKHLVLLGHSFGCPLIAAIPSVRCVKTIIFWNPSLHPSLVIHSCFQPKGWHKYICSGAIDVIISQKFVQEAKAFPSFSTLFCKELPPIGIITGGQAGAQIGQEQYYDVIRGKKRIFNIPRTGHCFDEHRAEDVLFKRTVEWLSLSDSAW